MIIALNNTEMESLINRLNNPTRENLEAKNKFFEECDELVILRDGNNVVVEYTDLDDETILATLNN